MHLFQGITGTSGLVYIECLLAQAFSLDRVPRSPGRLEVFGREDGLVPAAFGSNPSDAAVILPPNRASITGCRVSRIGPISSSPASSTICGCRMS